MLKIGYIYKESTHTHTQSGAQNSLSQFCLTITKPFSPFYLKETTRTNYWSLSVSRALSQLIMRVNKGHKVDFLCLKKRVWFYWECLLISCVFQLILVKLLIVFLCFYGVITELDWFVCKCGLVNSHNQLTKGAWNAETSI